MMYLIHESNIERLDKHMARIGKKCASLDLPFTYEKMGEEIKPVLNAKGEQVYVDGEPLVLRYIIVEVSGFAIRDDWEMVATIDHQDNGNIVRNVNSEIAVPERYFTSDCYCEHCKSNRERKQTMVIHNIKTNEFMQVGKACVKEYIKGLDAQRIAQWLEALDTIHGFEAPNTNGYECYKDLETYIRYAVETVKHFGYVKKYDELGEYNPDCTANRVVDFIWADRNSQYESAQKALDIMRSVGFNANTEEVKQTAQKVIEFCKNIEVTNEYTNNIKLLASEEYFNAKFTGFVVSMVAMYNREVERIAREFERNQKAEAEKVSDYVGEIGKRITINVVSATTISSYETVYGISYINKFVDADGNVYMWFGNKGVDEDTKSVTGTIKEHKEYNGVKQTILTRCKVA